MKKGGTTNTRRKRVRAVLTRGLWSVAFAMLLLAMAGCFGLEPPTDEDRDEGGFSSATISRCRIVLHVVVESDVSWVEIPMDGASNRLGSELDVSEIVWIDPATTGVDASYDPAARRFTASWDYGAYDETHLNLVLNDSGTAVSWMALEQTVSEDADLYRLKRRWEIEAHDLPYVGSDSEQGAWFRVHGEQMCEALSSVVYWREATAAGYTVLEQMSSHSCKDRSFLEVYLEP